MTIAIMSAMQEELDLLVKEVDDATQHSWGGRTYHQGVLLGIPAVLAFSRWGKVAAATTASYLLSHFDARALIFTGVAGGVDPALRVGDVVIGNKIYQHDMDARPLFKQFEIPLLETDSFMADKQLTRCALQACKDYFAIDLQNIPATSRESFE